MSRYLWIWPLANIRHHRWISLVTILGTAVAAFLVATLVGFVGGYERAVARDVDRLGYDLLITAKGCPYEAATLMLRGGVGLRYMPDGVVNRLRAEPGVARLYPTLIHPVREPSNEAGMILFKGVEPALKDGLDLELREGRWFQAPDEDGVVLGYEAAEFEQRHAGDAYLIPGGAGREAASVPVLGVLERTGTQIDGTVLMPLQRVQARFDLAGKLTGVGIRMAPGEAGLLPALRDRYQAEPELQVVSLSKVVDALRGAMETLREVVRILSVVLALLAAGVLLNTALLRSLGEHARLYTLHAIGLSRAFIGGAALLENLLLVGAGAALGVLCAVLAGGPSGALLSGYLPYAPKGDVVEITGALAAAIVGVALLLGALATIPPLLRIRWAGDPTAWREGA